MAPSRTRRGPGALLGEVARSVDATPALLPVLEELLRDLASLGSSPGRLAAMLERAGLRRGARVVDLACGKGTLSIELARRLGCRCVGVDAFAGFVEEAKGLAERRGVGRLCEFRVGDARRVRMGAQSDCAAMIGLWGVDEAAPVLRGLVRDGGLYVVDDAVRVGVGGAYSGVPTRAEARMFIEGLGDRVVACRLTPLAAVRSQNRRILGAIERRAGRIAVREPGLGGELRAFVRRQRVASADLEGAVRGCVWVVRKQDRGKWIAENAEVGRRRSGDEQGRRKKRGEGE